jgi:hypothetical protein
MKPFLAIILMGFALAGCCEKRTDNALEVYHYWAGTQPPEDMELMEGNYWKSAHWTKEYILFLKFKPTTLWWDEFLKQNRISEDKGEWILPADAPDWFTPSESSTRYGNGDKFNESRFFRDSQTGICYIYEIQF